MKFPVLSPNGFTVDYGQIRQISGDCEDCGTQNSMVLTTSTEYCIVCEEIKVDYWYHKQPLKRRMNLIRNG